MKNAKYHSVGTVPKYNIKIVLFTCELNANPLI